MKDEIVKTDNNISKIASALSKAQGVMSGAKKDQGNTFFNSRYSTLASVFEAVRQPFAANGLAITQVMDVLPTGQQILKTLLLHSSGEFIESKMLLPTDPNPQKIGSCLTYYRRYALMAIAGVPSEDDDGNCASRAAQSRLASGPISNEQISSLNDLLSYDKDPEDALNTIKARLKVASIAQIPSDRLDPIRTWLSDRIIAPKDDNESTES